MTNVSGEDTQRPALPAPGRRYWHAQTWADTLLGEFNAARRARDGAAARERFYILAAYFRRTLAILHAALEGGREELAAAALQNVIVLQRNLSLMREAAPNISLSTLALETNLRRRVNQDLVYRLLRDARGPLGQDTILRRFNELDVIADVREPAIEHALQTLVQTGHVLQRDGRYRPTALPHLDTNVDRMELAILFGSAVARPLAEAGFEGLSAVLEQRERFRETFCAETGFSDETAALATAAAGALLEPVEALHSARRWPHAELASSAHPRPYQRLLHAIFRAHRYQGQFIEAPAGSGKTLVGMLCIEDWLRTMAPGDTILVLVPTVSYQQQWVGELCISPFGLRLAPHLVFAGTPGGTGVQRRQGDQPTILVLTYGAVTRMGSGRGRGGFDDGAIERFLQANNVRHVILDEAHKVAADLSSPAAEMARVFIRWLKDGSLGSLVGFSGTLASYRRQLSSLGLTLASVVPAPELIAQGWVAPFAEFGAPFNYSARERRIVASIEEYRLLLQKYLQQMDSRRVRAAFAAMPMRDRTRLAGMLGMYSGRSDAAVRIQARLREWESGGAIRLSELRIFALLQLGVGWPDRRLLQEVAPGPLTVSPEDFEPIRKALRRDLPPGRPKARLSVAGFGETLQMDSVSARTVRDVLASTVVGGYFAAREWARQAGEGRVSVVRAILAAERGERPVSGVIIFDSASSLKWRDGIATPGFRGAGGMFAELAGDRTAVPMAVLGSELYLPDYPDDPLHTRISDWIFRETVERERGAALFEMIVTGAGLGNGELELLRQAFTERLAEFTASARGAGTRTLSDFDQAVLHPLREFTREHGLGRANRLVAWLSLREPHVRQQVAGLLDYAGIARAFQDARAVEVACGDGALRRLRVVPAGSGRRRQQLLDLTARLVDAEDLPIDVVVVSSWARTGWNVLTPNVLIDATATRDVVAWQQLRGRAMRPRPSWSGDAQRLVHSLVAPGASDGDPQDEGGLSPLAELPRPEARILDAVLAGKSPPTGREPAGELEALAAAVMLRENKVTHIYELVNARGAKAQVEYLRGARRWERSRLVSEKHGHEAAVRPADGVLLSGPGHAPMIVAEDPRRDSPQQFQLKLSAELEGADSRIVQGWLRAARQGQPDSP